MNSLVFLSGLSILKPDPGLIFWTTIIFLVVWIGLGKIAFKPIQNALKKRENDIQDALDKAKIAKQEMENLNSENQALLAKAREERNLMLKEAQEAKDNLISAAREEAKAEAGKIIANAKLEIDNQKKIALAEVKSEVGLIALDIAEKVLKQQLKGDKGQETFVNNLVDEIKFN